MINRVLEQFIEDKCPFEVKGGQRAVIARVADFLLSDDRDGICLLRGYAGTGKTSLLSALVRAMHEMKQKTVLMAPTGRAAKVFFLQSGHQAYTIHKRIYRQKSFSGETDNYTRNVNLQKHTLFIVDEASMISAASSGTAFGGTGCLLDEIGRAHV